MLLRPGQRQRPAIAAEDSGVAQCRKTPPAEVEYSARQWRAARATRSCPAAEAIPAKRHWSTPQHRLAANSAMVPAAGPTEASDHAHPPESPAQCRNREPGHGVENRHPANEFAHRIAPRRTALPHSDLRRPPLAPAAVSQSAAAHPRNPSAGRRDQPVVRRESYARIREKEHRNEFPAPSTTRPTELRTVFSPNLRPKDCPHLSRTLAACARATSGGRIARCARRPPRRKWLREDSGSWQGQQILQSAGRAGCSPNLRADGFCGALSQGGSLSIVRQQFQKYQGQLCRTDNPHRVAALKQVHDVAEIFRVIADHDRDPM